MGVKCFYMEPTDKTRISLRRYVPSSEDECPAEGQSYHTTKNPIDTVEGEDIGASGKGNYEGDERWPDRCKCGYEYQEGDKWQVFTETLYERQDTGELVTIHDAPPGAMWNAHWMQYEGPDGRCLTVKLPNGRHWMIDSRASNCDRPDDDDHQCWPRKGEPPNITVDKDFGDTCGAGAGSIQAGDYHGFLRDGELTT